MRWLPEPDPGTSICLGFDGSDVDDHTALRCETREGHIFTPRVGHDRRPAHWDPAQYNGLVPRVEVSDAVAEIYDRFEVRRFYPDPPRWQTDVEQWALDHGDTVMPFWTQRTAPMFNALRRFVADLTEGRVTHDGCPITATQLANARRIGVGGDKYKLAKASQHQKIDAAMAVVLAHEAASDERAAGWPTADTRVFCFTA